MTDLKAKRIGIVGGGAAGMMAACAASEYGAQVSVFEKNRFLGRKLSITGKGRCNVTNNCTEQEFIANVISNPRFMYTAINTFSPQDTMDFFTSAGVELKTERGNRVFPSNDKAKTIVDALASKMKDCRVIRESVTDIIINDGRAEGVKTAQGEYSFDCVIIATGGISYPLTGSTGDGYRFAKGAGHTVTELAPSLVPLEAKGRVCAQLQGLSLKNVSVSVTDSSLGGKVIYKDFGEMMFTHFGVTGPMILSASAHMKDIVPGRYKMYIDLKPALDEKTLDARLLRDFSERKNCDFSNSLGALLPSKMIPVFVELCGIEGTRKVNSITKEERKKILALLKSFEVTITRARPIDEAIITQGGVCVSEINPKTMESKKINGLYFAGEVLDVDAYTGGFNLQIAFSTATLAGRSAAMS